MVWPIFGGRLILRSFTFRYEVTTCEHISYFSRCFGDFDEKTTPKGDEKHCKRVGIIIQMFRVSRPNAHTTPMKSPKIHHPNRGYIALTCTIQPFQAQIPSISC
jgi:hypothetical protein